MTVDEIIRFGHQVASTLGRILVLAFVQVNHLRGIPMVLAQLFGGASARLDPHPLYIALVDQARTPDFFGSGRVPDTLDGRFDMICVHAFLVLNRLKQEGVAAKGFAQGLFDAMFLDMDRGLRELGVGDLGVGIRVKHMAKALYGRIAAYEAGLGQADDATLLEALRRNLYGTTTAEPDELARVARYMRAAKALLAAQSFDDLVMGRVRFPALQAV
jgi:cytochrome b pre-mRNA-processing protein 3